MSDNTPYIGYEYKDVTVPRYLEGLYVDGYEDFGWRLDATVPIVPPQEGPPAVALRFKREYGIGSRMDLIRLEREFESRAREIEKLKSSESASALGAALGIGIVGVACIVRAVFAYLAGAVPLMIVLAIPGCVGCVLPYFCYKKIAAKRARTVTALVNSAYDSIYALCGEARELLAA